MLNAVMLRCCLSVKPVGLYYEETAPVVLLLFVQRNSKKHGTWKLEL